jgi:hypothetical protein
LTELKISKVLAKKVWDKLNTTAVPIVGPQEFINIEHTINTLNENIDKRVYFPGNIHGYLGIEKRYGVARFIPIINHIDMAVYYQLCGEIGDHAIENLEGVFGGWQVVPTPQARTDIANLPKDEQVAKLYSQEYFSETFSSAAWFQNYISFTDLLKELIATGTYGDHVGITDIANFYDSIDIGKLIGKLRQRTQKLEQHLSLLEIYLSFWNRRLSGYQASNRGIPQEIISDGSRNLSHAYLHNFDEAMIEYTKKEGIKYVRWADDILFFASSRRKIESAMYKASQLLLQDGLNLSAPKTNIMPRSEFEKYRCLGLLDAIAKKDDAEFIRQVILIEGRVDRKLSVKIDTAIRAIIGHLIRFPHLRSPQNTSFVYKTIAKNHELLSNLNSQQLLGLCTMSPVPETTLNTIKNYSLRRDLIAPRAGVLKLLRDENRGLNFNGINKIKQIRIINDIEKNSKESEIISNFCAPAALSEVKYRL